MKTTYPIQAARRVAHPICLYNHNKVIAPGLIRSAASAAVRNGARGRAVGRLARMLLNYHTERSVKGSDELASKGGC